MISDYCYYCHYETYSGNKTVPPIRLVYTTTLVVKVWRAA